MGKGFCETGETNETSGRPFFFLFLYKKKPGSMVFLIGLTGLTNPFPSPGDYSDDGAADSGAESFTDLMFTNSRMPKSLSSRP